MLVCVISVGCEAGQPQGPLYTMSAAPFFSETERDKNGCIKHTPILLFKDGNSVEQWGRLGFEAKRGGEPGETDFQKCIHLIFQNQCRNSVKWN